MHAQTNAQPALLTHLPFVLSQMPIVLEGLTADTNTDLSPALAVIASRARAEFVYVMDSDGRTLASSNCQQPESLVGEYCTFRPLFSVGSC